MMKRTMPAGDFVCGARHLQRPDLVRVVKLRVRRRMSVVGIRVAHTITLIKYNIMSLIHSRPINTLTPQRSHNHFRVFIASKVVFGTYDRPIDIAFIMKYCSATAAAPYEIYGAQPRWLGFCSTTASIEQW